MTEKRFAEGKRAIRWIEDEDIISDIDELAARDRINRTDWIKRAVRQQIRREQSPME
jgi:hypothetical protein